MSLRFRCRIPILLLAVIQIFHFTLAADAAEPEPVPLFANGFAPGVEASAWKTFSLAAINGADAGHAGKILKITSNRAHAGCNIAFRRQQLDLTPYWAGGALVFRMNGTGKLRLGSIRLLYAKESGNSVENINSAGNLVPPLDRNRASWQEVVIPLRVFSDNPIKTFKGVRLRNQRELTGELYLADIRIVPTYDKTKVYRAKSQKTALRIPARKKPRPYIPATTQGEFALTAGTPAVTVKSIPVRDCRWIRGFFWRAVDGRRDSFGWLGNGPRAIKKHKVIEEWPQVYSGIDYDFNQQNGLHVLLADKTGIDMLVIHGGYAGKIYTDVTTCKPPWGGEVLTTCADNPPVRQICFPGRIPTNRISFIDRTSGSIANSAFYRIEKRGAAANAANSANRIMRLYPGTIPGKAPPGMAAFLAREFGQCHVRILSKEPDRGKQVMEPGHFLHFISQPFSREILLDRVNLHLTTTGMPNGATLRIRLADPFNPRLELLNFDINLPGNGGFDLDLDFIDQVVPKGSRLWLTLGLSHGAIAAMGATRVDLLAPGNPAHATQEYLAYRKQSLKSYFSILSETRPWFNKREILKNREAMLNYKYGGDALWEMVCTLKELKRLAPDDEVVDVYYKQVFGYSSDRLPAVKIDDAGPDWALLIRENLRRLLKIADWWIQNRQVPNGEFGGMVGDDTDLLMNFQTYPMCDSGPTGRRIREAFRLLTGYAARTTMIDGLNRHQQDPLHAYEEGVNIFAVMPMLFYGNPVYIERCMASVRSLQKITARLPSGRRYFMQAYRQVGALRKNEKPKGDYEHDSHFLMLHAALTLGWYNRNPAAIRFLREIFDSYLFHMQPNRWPDRIYLPRERVTFRTNRPLTFMADSAFMFMYCVTNDQAYLAPFHYGFGRNNWGWACHRSMVDLLTMSDLKSRYKTIPLATEKHPFVYFAMTGNRKPVCDRLDSTLRQLDKFMYFYTAAEIFDDRIFVPNDAVRPMLGGYAERNKLNPSMAVEWQGFDHNDYAAFVWSAGNEHLRVALYNFTDKPLTGGLRPWRLRNGIYRSSEGIDANDDGKIDSPANTGTFELYRHALYRITLPPRRVYLINLRLEKPLDPLLARCDIAACAQECRWNAATRTLRVRVHNIGSKPTGGFNVSILDMTGKTLVSTQVNSIAAPLDLTPEFVDLQLTLPTSPTRLQVLLDRENLVREITEENNSFILQTGKHAGE